MIKEYVNYHERISEKNNYYISAHMQIPEELVEHIGVILSNAQKILLIGHRNPDGDAMGSILGLHEVLEQRGKICQPVIVDEELPENLKFLPHSESVRNTFNLLEYDAVVICDSAAKHMTGYLETCPELFDDSTGIPVINIDHHASNEEFGTVNLVRTDAASTTVLITRVLTQLNWKINAKAATCFLTGIYTDTGSFMHSNTNPFTLKLASKLLSKGANLRQIRKEIFKTTKISTLRLWGRVLQNMYKNDEGIVISVVTEEDFEETESHHSELSGVIDYVNSVPNSDFSIILTERDGKVKGSLRTLKDDVDLNEVASQFGGGGHKKAAGFTLPGRLEREVVWKVVN